MVDMLFHYNKKIYVYYNMHRHLPFAGGYSESPYLCKKWDKVQDGPIFMTYTSIPPEDIKEGGNEYVVI